MNVVERYRIAGRTASAIADSVERAVGEGRAPRGATLPTVRALAGALGVSPGTAAAAYRSLALRGVVAGEGRRGTRVAAALSPAAGPVTAVAAHLRDLADGNPDPALLPRLGPFLKRLSLTPHLYGDQGDRADLLAVAERELRRDGLPRGGIAALGGALDAVERVLQAHLRPGDRVAVEDPGYPGVIDLVAALGLLAEPVALDERGVTPEALEGALRRGAAAVVLTPRAQNPTGAALDPARARDLRRVLARRPQTLVVEDDHAGPVAGAPAVSLCAGAERWAIVRSTSKWLGPDLRLSLVVADPTTLGRVRGRQALGAGWVSHVLQALVAALWTNEGVRALLAEAERTYAARRAALVGALRRRGIPAEAPSGLNVWLPVPHESAAVAAMAARGWAVRPGERYRLRSGPALRITIARLHVGDAERVAEDLHAVLRPARPSRLA